MTNSTQSRIARLYEKVVGYHPLLEGWTAAKALNGLRWQRTALTLNPDDPSAYVGPILTKAELIHNA